MYVGEATRPNTCVLVITGNTLRLSADMADRCFIIRLVRPEYDPAWESRVKQFARQYREEILADIVWTLQQEPVRSTAKDRWMPFVHEVLARCPQASPEDVVALIHERRGIHDEDKEEADVILDALIEREGQALSKHPGWYFLPRSTVASIVRDELHIKATTKDVISILKRHIEADHFGKPSRLSADYIYYGKRGYIYYKDIQDEISSIHVNDSLIDV